LNRNGAEYMEACMTAYLNELNQILQVVGVYYAFAVLEPYNFAMLMAMNLRVQD
jgi:hypothetical protein